ncbi:MAG: aldo/keto reductase [Tannerella sp.]|jgi:predicted aldo/keto reductase-like oxidoreductase|nr:aldo/keto reductase [Tannerella sp.]
MNRRKFIKTGVAGMATISMLKAGNIGNNLFFIDDEIVDKVKLGESGLTVSRIAMGTGTHGSNKSSDQTKLGMDQFVKLAHHAYEKGIRFYDMADGYGSQPYVGKAIKTLPRENLTLLSKMWTHEDGSEINEPVRQIIDRFRKEADTDYFDILLMHCLMDGKWPKNRKHYMDGLSKAKQDGLVKAVGVSCHNWDALVEAAESPWVDVIMARINPFGTLMDNTPDAVKELLGKARRNGKGLIAMKVFGEGKHVTDGEREQSLKFIIEESNVHCMTLGMPSETQMDDAVARVVRLAKA